MVLIFQKPKPEKYQLSAIKDIHSELSKKPRTTAIMACGTGKTNIALWVFEKLKPKLTIVFVPSIALVKQIRADWLEQISISEVKTLQVCSFKETSAREDQLMIEKVDLDFQVTTDAKIIKVLLKKPEVFKNYFFLLINLH